MAMTCYENSINTFQNKKAKLYVCASVSGNNIDVQLKGDPKEDIQIRGYVQFILEEANDYDAWVEKGTNRPGLWEDSRKGSMSGRLFRDTKPSLVRVIAKIYSDSTYKYLLSTSSTNAFERG